LIRLPGSANALWQASNNKTTVAIGRRFTWFLIFDLRASPNAARMNRSSSLMLVAGNIRGAG
jgi:hypothetical protein